MAFRLKYFFSHLFISVLIASASLYLIFKVWYPAPLDMALGVGQILLIMLVIDVILGPLLTLIIAKQGKKSLKFDLLIIALVQLTALAYGLYSIDKGRPVWLAFDVKQFEIVQKYIIIPSDKTLPQYAQYNWFGPQWVYVRPAKDNAELQQRIENELQQGISATMQPELYEPIESNMDHILSKAEPIDKLNKFNDKDDVAQVLERYPQADVYIPMRASLKLMTVLLDSKNKKIVAIVDLHSW